LNQLIINLLLIVVVDTVGTWNDDIIPSVFTASIAVSHTCHSNQESRLAVSTVLLGTAGVGLVLLA
jgi:hypothetical protein